VVRCRIHYWFVWMCCGTESFKHNEIHLQMQGDTDTRYEMKPK
jgi:hypothetical protein